MKVAIVHYWLHSMRGGERVVEALCELFPEADIYTHIVDRSNLSETINRHEISTTFISKLPFARSQYQKYLPFMPRALEELDLTEYDLVISSESGPAKGVITRPDSLHICYCHSPMRYIWDHYNSYLKDAGFLSRLAFPWIAHRMRIWDVSSAARVDAFIANSRFVQKRIEKYFRRESSVIHPPVAVDEFASARKEGAGEYYLAAGELVGYKRFDLVIQACNQLKVPLVIVGEGEQRQALEKIAGETVRFLGRVGLSELKSHFGNCRALIFPGEEDFGIVPVEVMAAGRPVIAYGRGGALDTVADGTTGVLFEDQTVGALAEAIQRFETLEFESTQLQAHAQTFSKAAFKHQFIEFLEQQGLSRPDV